MPSESNETDLTAINAALEVWRQGDVILEPTLPFIVLAHATMPITQAALEAAAVLQERDDPVLDVQTQEIGIVILSQTCDIVRDAGTRPYVEIAPLVEVAEDDYRAIAKGRSLQYAAIPSMAGRMLVGDLDRTMTIEKPLLLDIAQDGRIEGCTTDQERRILAKVLARRRSRFAFPDDFAISVKKISSYVIEKHSKDSDLGKFVQALEDIRVECPDWDAAAPVTCLLFVFEKAGDIPANAQDIAEKIMERFIATGAFAQLGHQIVSLEAMTAARYRQSDALDLDFLSTPVD